jgi:DNA polymerase-3 subunit epsilon
MFCIVDLETTGGRFEEESVMEIALFKFDGQNVVDQLISLVNVEDKPIQPYVQKLTGITPKMLIRAPKFYQLAKRIIEITKDCVLVAHNADFDYRMLQMEFGRLGYDFNMPTVDTIDWAKKLIPDQPAYGLEKLCKSLGITHTHKHRAEGDTRATLELFKILLEKDVSKDLMRYGFHEEENKHTFSYITEKAKNVVGVYYLLNKKGKVIYIGRSNFLKNRLNRHFIANSEKANAMQGEVADIKIEETGNELLSRIKEYIEIKKLRPHFNSRNQAYYLPLAYVKQKKKIAIGKAGAPNPIVFFESKNDARTIAAQWCIGNGLNPDLEFEHPENVYVGKEVERLLNTGVEYSGDWNELLMPEPTFALILDGRHPQEKCVVYIEKQTVKGYAYMELNTQIRNKSLVKKLISPFPKDPYIFSLTVKFIQEKKFTDIVTF